jgi:clan AA aspartic protease (TIGR02281 family)
MNFTLRHSIAAILVLVSISAPVFAGPMEDGLAAYKRGDYKTAIRILRPLADQGNAMAEVTVGTMYKNGFGVPLDYVTAYMWYSVAAAHGASLGAFLLNAMTSEMTQAEVAEAEKRAREWPNIQPRNTTTYAETWSCDTELNKKPYIQEWTISDGRMTAPHGQGYYRVAQNDGRVLVAFHKKRDEKGVNDPILILIMIDKKTGSYFDINTITMSVMGKTYDETSKPDVSSTGHCTLLRPPQRVAALPSPKLSQPSSNSSQVTVPLKVSRSGTFLVPVEINGRIVLDFTLDSGASDVTLPNDVFMTLKRTGTLKETDVVGQRTYVLADGSKTQSATFTIRSLKVGDIIVENVAASVAPSQGSLLLGQSFLQRFKSWSIDNATGGLLLETQ